MIIILKNYNNKLNKGSWKEAKQELDTYGEYLEGEGWINDWTEAGYVSPDLSTIFYYGRSPYEGQLIQFRANRREDFENIVEKLKKDFIKL